MSGQGVNKRRLPELLGSLLDDERDGLEDVVPVAVVDEDLDAVEVQQKHPAVLRVVLDAEGLVLLEDDGVVLGVALVVDLGLDDEAGR